MPAIRVTLPTLVTLTGERTFSVEGGSVAETMRHLERAYPGFAKKVTAAGRFQGHLMVVAKYAGETVAELTPRPDDDRPGLVELAFLPIPEGG
ncbi:MAG: ubiquitin family protein [Bacillota bacterium]